MTRRKLAGAIAGLSTYGWGSGAKGRNGKYSGERVSIRFMVTKGGVTKSFLSTSTIPIDPWAITGIIDAEGSFIIRISESKGSKTGWAVSALFQFSMNIRDKALMEEIKGFFGEGIISVDGNVIQFRIKKLGSIIKLVLPHFDKYPLVTQKLADYLLFRQAVMLMKKKRHLTLEGLKEVLSIRASLNTGLSDKQESAFPGIVAVDRPIVVNKVVPDPN